MKYLIVTLGMVVGVSINSMAQTPKDDKTWVLVPNGSNEFNWNTNNSKSKTKQSKYFHEHYKQSDAGDTAVDKDYKYPVNGNYGTYQLEKRNSDILNGNTPLNYYDATLLRDSNNIEISNGTLKIIARKYAPPIRIKFFDTNWRNGQTDGKDTTAVYYSFTTASMQSNYFAHPPYYLESKCRFPAGNHNGIQASIWNYMGNDGRGDSIVWNEIDLFEYSGSSNYFTHNFHWEENDSTYNKTHFALNPTSTAAINDLNLRREDFYFPKVNHARNTSDSGWHIYGVEVTQQYVAWYIDGKQIEYARFPFELYKTVDNNGLKQLESIKPKTSFFPRFLDYLSIELGINTMPGFNDTPSAPDGSTEMPFKFEIDYLRIYKLDTSTISISSLNYNLDSHPMKIYNSINLGGSGGSASLSSGKTTTLRADEEIILNDGFEIPQGAEIYITNTKRK